MKKTYEQLELDNTKLLSEKQILLEGMEKIIADDKSCNFNRGTNFHKKCWECNCTKNGCIKNIVKQTKELINGGGNND